MTIATLHFVPNYPKHLNKQPVLPLEARFDDCTQSAEEELPTSRRHPHVLERVWAALRAATVNSSPRVQRVVSLDRS